MCQSSFWKDYFVSKKVNLIKLLVIENWVDDTKIKESKTLDYPKFKGNNKEKFKIVLVSRIEKAKGVDDIITLAQQLKNGLDFSIFVYGAGSYQGEFVQSIKSNQLEDVIHFKGWLEKEKMLKTINAHHLAIFSSQTEGYRNKICEAMAMSKPVIVTKVSDVPLFVKGNENGFLCEGDNLETIKAALIKAVNANQSKR